jgi:hypothetical protein
MAKVVDNLAQRFRQAAQERAELAVADRVGGL